jgi:hypothetical protein
VIKHQANLRIWAFCGGLIGLLAAWGRLTLPWTGDGIRINSIELVVQCVGFALIAAFLAYMRNRLGNK